MGNTRKGNESAKTLYQRNLSLVDSTLLMPDSDLCHHGKATNSKDRTLCVEKLLVCLWVKALHPSLPPLVKQRYATQLKDCTLPSIREEISGCITELLAELGEKDPPHLFQANTNIRPTYPFKTRTQNYQQPRFSNRRFQTPLQNQTYGNFQPRLPQHN